MKSLFVNTQYVLQQLCIIYVRHYLSSSLLSLCHPHSCHHIISSKRPSSFFSLNLPPFFLFQKSNLSPPQLPILLPPLFFRLYSVSSSLHRTAKHLYFHHFHILCTSSSLPSLSLLQSFRSVIPKKRGICKVICSRKNNIELNYDYKWGDACLQACLHLLSQ